MKVLYVASGTGMTGGATKSLISMLSQIKAHGINFELVCPDEAGLTQWLREQGVKVHVVRFMHAKLPTLCSFSDLIKWVPRFIYYSWINHQGKASMKKILKGNRPDIIHENSSVINIAYSASKSLGIPEVVHIREYGDLDFNMKLPDRKRRLKGKHVFTIPITRDISRHLEQDKNPRACQIYDGMVHDSDFTLNENKQKWFLYAGRIANGKGIEDLLKAYVDYVHKSSKPYPLYVCGTGVPSYVEKMKAFVEENRIQDNIVWCGEQDNISSFMQQTAATIIPSKNEGLGRVMPEAMTNGSLCIAKNTGGTKEQLENGEQFTGAPIAIAYENNEQLTNELLYVSETIEKGDAFKPGTKFRQMIDRSQEAVKEFFTEERFGEKVYDFYNKILESKEKN